MLQAGQVHRPGSVVDKYYSRGGSCLTVASRWTERSWSTGARRGSRPSRGGWWVWSPVPRWRPGGRPTCGGTRHGDTGLALRLLPQHPSGRTGHDDRPEYLVVPGLPIPVPERPEEAKAEDRVA